jgi:hypothetical protein
MNGAPTTGGSGGGATGRRPKGGRAVGNGVATDMVCVVSSLADCRGRGMNGGERRYRTPGNSSACPRSCLVAEISWVSSARPRPAAGFGDGSRGGGGIGCFLGRPGLRLRTGSVEGASAELPWAILPTADGAAASAS